jgi:3,4-dihydroxy 2-butanone 4-phosphate synthase/GTP cyclohydrolase II
MPIKRVQEAIKEIKKGNMIIMIDDEDRENEGDLVYASMFSTAQKVNFMATHAKGLICVALSSDIAKQLNLAPMVKNNNSSYETAFTVSVDAKEALTGISASERDMTIRLLSDPLTKPTDLVRPGHIFPLIAKDGGTLIRTGHTEGSVDICKLAGLTQSSVICEIMKEDGSMARRLDLEKFAQKHKLKSVYISDLVEYRLRNESLVQEISEEKIIFLNSNVIKKEFNDHQNNIHTAIVFGDCKKFMNIKVHHIASDLDLLSNQKKHTHLMDSIEYLKQNSGVLMFLDMPNNANKQMKEFGIGAQILKTLKITKINLITSHKNTEFIGLSGYNLEILKTIKI